MRLLRLPLLALLLSLLGCGDPTDGVTVLPQPTSASAASTLLVARGGEVTFQVVADTGLIGNVGAVSSDPKILKVSLVGQELGSGIAYVHTTGLATGPVELAFTVDGEALTTLDLDVHAVADVSFVRPEDQLEAVETTRDNFAFDARSRVALTVVPFDASGAPLLGRGLVEIEPIALPLPCEITADGNRDQLVLTGATPADYSLPLRVAGQTGRTLTYHAIAATAATAIDYFGDVETDGHLAAGDRACLGVAPLAESTRIFAAQADWTLGTNALEGGPAAYVCYTYSPGEKALTLAAKFGSQTATRQVHGARFTIHPDVASLASEWPTSP
jgi:hypothetical protein